MNPSTTQSSATTPATEAATATQAEFARLQGWRRSYVTQLKREGRLVMSADGKHVDIAASIARIAQTRSPDKTGVTHRHATTRSTPAALPGVDDDNDDDDDDEDAPIDRPDFQAARARREQARAQREEIELAKEVGTLLVAEEVEEVIADAITNFRTSIESIGALAAVEVAAETDPIECRRIIDEHTRCALTELANRFAGIAQKETR